MAVPDDVRDRYMPLRTVAAGALVCALLLLMSVAEAGAGAKVWRDVTVVSITGWRYSHVDIELLEDGKQIVMISEDGGRKTTSLSNIRMVLDERGKDITANIFNAADADSASLEGGLLPVRSPGEYDAPGSVPHPTPLTVRPETARQDRVRVSGNRFRVGLSGGVGYGWSMGEWFEGLTSGAAFEAAGRITITNHVMFGVQYRYQRLGVESEWERLYICDDYMMDCILVNLDWDVHLSEFFVSIGVYSEPSGLRTPIGYAEFGIGTIAHSLDVTASAGDVSDSADDSTTELAFLWTAGVIFPLNRTFGINLEGTMRATGSGDILGSYYSYYDSGSTGIVLGLRFGVMVMLGD